MPSTLPLYSTDLQYSDDDYLATKFNLDTTVDLKAGEEFFVVVGPFPNSSLEESPYTIARHLQSSGYAYAYCGKPSLSGT